MSRYWNVAHTEVAARCPEAAMTPTAQMATTAVCGVKLVTAKLSGTVMTATGA
jgi:hypothetical protein